MTGFQEKGVTAMFKHAVRAAARSIFAFATLSCAARAGFVFTEFNAPGSNFT